MGFHIVGKVIWSYALALTVPTLVILIFYIFVHILFVPYVTYLKKILYKMIDIE